MRGLSEEQRKKMEALGVLEQGALPALDYETDSPMGVVNVTRAPLRPPPIDMENLPVAGPTSGLGGTSTTAKPSPLPAVFHDKPAGIRDEDLEAATELDADARSRMLFETATRQLIGGLTRTPTVASLGTPGTAAKDLIAKRRQGQIDALKGMELGLGKQKFDYEQKTEAQKTAEAKARDERDFAEKQREFALSQKQAAESAAATRQLAGAGLGFRAREEEVKTTEREEKKSSGEMPLMGGTLVLNPGLSDTERGQARTAASAWNAADEAVANFQKELEAFAKNPSVKTKGNVTAALRTASSAFNAAIGGGAMAESEARAMSEAMGADLLSPSGIAAIAQSVLGSNDAEAAKTITNRVRAARQANRAAALGKLKTYGTFSEAGGAAKPAQSTPAGAFVTLIDESGEELDVAPGKVESVLKAHPKMRRK